MVLNGLIGAGIFALPASVAAGTGMFSPWMFLICGLLFLPVVLSFAKVASYFSATGGPVLYARAAFGPFIGFQTGWLLYLGRVTALAANSNALLNYAGLLWPWLGAGLGRAFGMAVFFVLLTSVNVAGVRRGMAATNALAVLKLLPLLLFIAVGIGYIVPEPFFTAAIPAGGEFTAALLLVVYAFVGFEGALVPAGESRDPQRDIPRALVLTVCTTAIFYALIQTVCVAVLPDLAVSKTPISDVANATVGSVGALVMTFAAFFSIAGNLSAIMIAAPRMTYAMARDKTLPPSFCTVHEQYKTPAYSIIFLGILGFGMAVSGTFVWLAVMSALTRMLGYGVSIASLPLLHKRFKSKRDLFNLRGGFAIPAAALAICFWLALQADWKSWGMAAVFAVVGAALYHLSRSKFQNGHG